MKRWLAPALLLSACGGPPLPEQRPADLRIRYSRDAGMVPAKFNAELSSGGCRIVRGYGRARPPIENRIEFQLDGATLDRLYQVFREHRFERIERIAELAHDKPGVTLDLSWKGRYQMQTSSGAMIAPDHRQRWKAVVAAVEAVLEAELERRKVRFGVGLEDSLIGEWVQVDLDHETLFAGRLTRLTVFALRPVAGRCEIRASTGRGPTGGEQARLQVEAGPVGHVRVHRDGGKLAIEPQR